MKKTWWKSILSWALIMTIVFAIPSTDVFAESQEETQQTIPETEPEQKSEEAPVIEPEDTSAISEEGVEDGIATQQEDSLVIENGEPEDEQNTEPEETEKAEEEITEDKPAETEEPISDAETEESTEEQESLKSIPESAELLSLDTAYDVVINEADQMVYYRFVPEETNLYAFTSMSSSDTYGYLYDVDENQLAYNDDSGEGNNFRVCYKLTAGETYYFAAKYLSNETGTFSVMLTIAQTGWVQVDSDSFYFNEDGSPAEGLVTIDEVTYGFDSEGRLVKDNTVYNPEDGKNYICDAEGVLVTTPGWYEDSNGWRYYIKDNSELAYGWLKIDNNWYYFSNYMYYGGSYQIYNESTGSSKAYLFADDGVLYTKTGWIKQNDQWYYVKNSNGELYCDGFHTINDKEFYFSYEGRMYQNEAFTVDGVNYVADNNGYISQLKNGWNQISDKWYYVKDGETLKDEVKEISGSFYAFDPTGVMVRIPAVSGHSFR